MAGSRHTLARRSMAEIEYFTGAGYFIYGVPSRRKRQATAVNEGCKALLSARAVEVSHVSSQKHDRTNGGAY